MSDARVVLRGGPELRRALNRVSKTALSRATLEESLMHGAEPIKQAARSKAPGHIAEGIKAKPVRTRGRGKRASSEVYPTVAVYPESYVALFVELGTRAHVIRPMKRGGWLRLHGGQFVRKVLHLGARERPFLRPAFDNNWARAVTIFGQDLMVKLEEAWRR